MDNKYFKDNILWDEEKLQALANLLLDKLFTK